MGADQSRDQDDRLAKTIPITPQSTPLCYTDTRFCLPRNVTLHLNCPTSEEDFTFTEAHGNGRVTFFRCNGHDFSGCFESDQGKEKFLKDTDGATVLYLKRKLCSCMKKSNIFADTKREKHICRIRSHVAFMRVNFSVTFSDASSDCILWLKGDLETYCNFYLGDPKEGGVLIARMISLGPVLFWSATDFTVEIAANVDIAVVAMLCILVEQDCRDQRKALTKERR